MFFIYLMTIEDEEERKSIEELYYKYRYQCFHMAKKYVSNDELAEDMVQETFVRIIKHRKEYLKLSGREFEALLVTIIKNLAKDEYKKGQKQGYIHGGLWRGYNKQRYIYRNKGYFGR